MVNSMRQLIKQFKIHAKQLDRNSSSINELKLWVLAHKTEEFNKIFQENQGFKSSNIYSIIMLLREKYKLDDKKVTSFLRTYILNPPEIDASMELDRTDGKPGTSNEEFREDLIGLG